MLGVTRTAIDNRPVPALNRVEVDARLQFDEHRSRARGGQTATPRAVARHHAPETTLAVSGLVSIAVHVLDDKFFQPRPGTSLLDDPVGGLIPVAVVSVAAARSCLTPIAKTVAQPVTPRLTVRVKEDRDE